MAVTGTTLDEARQIVRGVSPQQTGDEPPPGSPRQPGESALDYFARTQMEKQGGTTPTDQGPGPWVDEYGGGTPSAEGANMLPPGFEPIPGHDGYYYNPDLDRIAVFEPGGYNADGSLKYNVRSLTSAEDNAFRASYAAAAGGDGGATGGGGVGGSGRTSFDTGPGYLNLAGQKFASDEDQRRIDNENWLRQFGLSQTTANRNELGQRAGVGLSTGNLALDLALRQDKLANDPGNFPAWLQAMQGNTAQGPVAQSLVGAGTTITPAPNDYLNDPRFKGLLDSLLNYGTVPNAGAVDQTQQAYNTNAADANTFFSQDPEALKRMFGTPMATGGSFTTSGPMTFKDLSSGKNIATAGEAGKEQITVTPLNSPNAAAEAQTNSTGQGWMDAWRAYHPGQADPVPGYGVSPSSGTAMALGKTFGAGGFSFVPPDIRDTLLAGNLPTPGQFPDWMLAKMPPSIRALVGALITSKLGSSGAADYDWTRGQYEAKGFNGSGGVVR